MGSAALAFSVSGASAAPPSVTINPVGTVGHTTAQVSGTVDPADQETYFGFEYSADPASEGWSFFAFEGPIAAGAGVQNVSDELTGLRPGVDYQVRLAALNVEEFVEYFSNEPNPTFTTPADAPVVARAYASSVGSATAELGVKINPEGAQTSYHFQYVSLAEFEAHGFSGAIETAETPLGAGNTDLVGSAQITGLASSVTYVYRAIASNAVGTITGSQAELHTPASSSPNSGGCSNEEFRIGPSAALPDCRAYEQVTPVEKSNQDGVFFNGFLLSSTVSVDGNRAAYFSFGSFAGSPAPNPIYLATSGATNWASEGMIPRQSTSNNLIISCAPQFRAYTPDLSRGILEDGEGACSGNEPPIVPDEPQGPQNLFLRDNATGTYQLINVTPPGVTPAPADFGGASPDLSHVVFNESAPLTSDAASGNMLYEWSGGSVKLIGLVPAAPATSCSGSECLPAAGARIGGEPLPFEAKSVAKSVSADGSRVFFRAGGNLYLREGDTTTQVDVSHGPGPSGSGQFWTATENGSSVFFTDTAKLTGDATANEGAPDLYRYDVGGTLSDLTVDATDATGANVLGVVGASEDGSYLYFVAEGVLTSTPNSHDELATAGQPNLYLSHDGAVTFIGTLAPSFVDEKDWNGNSTNRLTADGKVLAFNSTRSLTGYDNTEANTGEPAAEIFLYEAEANTLVCASCNPSGARPLGPSQLEELESRPKNTEPSGPARDNFSLQRNLSEDGRRLFFNSSDALVPADTNGRQDVYEYENGEVHLISTGQSSGDARFYDASASGDDVFFITRDRLVGQDTDDFTDLYDARVGGGFASQNTPPSSPPCSGGACKGSPTSPPADQGPGSSTFSGPGNQGKTSKPGCKRIKGKPTKCVKKRHKPHKHKKQSKHHMPPKQHKQHRRAK